MLNKILLNETGMSDEFVDSITTNIARLGFLLLIIHYLRMEGYAHGDLYEAGVSLAVTGVVMGIVGAFLFLALTPVGTTTYQDKGYSRRR